MEFGDTERVFKNPLHPYTRMLLESVPDLNVKWEFKGEIRPEEEERSVYEIGGDVTTLPPAALLQPRSAGKLGPPRSLKLRRTTGLPATFTGG
ncbi:hypothetical protein [Thermococcus sp. JCM 11816]|uniref:ABC transporter ATP-binding protein n=1 Tax=Thermococcus sp. (strain JCM 11816 / KS-1) TaxID=1295125 RepID=UPI000A994E57